MSSLRPLTNAQGDLDRFVTSLWYHPSVHVWTVVSAALYDQHLPNHPNHPNHPSHPDYLGPPFIVVTLARETSPEDSSLYELRLHFNSWDMGWHVSILSSAPESLSEIDCKGVWFPTHMRLFDLLPRLQRASLLISGSLEPPTWQAWTIWEAMTGKI